MKLEAAACTNVGSVRENNEDNFYINGYIKKDVTENICSKTDCIDRKYYTYAVFDGVGGEDNGEIASLDAADELMEYDTCDLHDRFEEYVQAANQRVCQEVREREGRRMASTVVILTTDGVDANICSVGDSRAYVMRNGKLYQLTLDHTKTQAKRNHMLTQYLGAFPEEFRNRPHIVKNIQLMEEDIFLLCSDGLTDMVQDADIETIMRDNQDSPAEQIAEELIQTAIQNGGKDNVTTVIVKIN